MAQSIVNFRLDESIKKKMEKVCKDMGMSMSTAFTIFAVKVAKEGRIPFEITADPFYKSESQYELASIVAPDLALGAQLTIQIRAHPLLCVISQSELELPLRLICSPHLRLVA